MVPSVSGSTLESKYLHRRDRGRHHALSGTTRSTGGRYCRAPGVSRASGISCAERGKPRPIRVRHRVQGHARWRVICRSRRPLGELLLSRMCHPRISACFVRFPTKSRLCRTLGPRSRESISVRRLRNLNHSGIINSTSDLEDSTRALCGRFQITDLLMVRFAPRNFDSPVNLFQQ